MLVGYRFAAMAAVCAFGLVATSASSCSTPTGDQATEGIPDAASVDAGAPLDAGALPRRDDRGGRVRRHRRPRDRRRRAGRGRTVGVQPGDSGATDAASDAIAAVRRRPLRSRSGGRADGPRVHGALLGLGVAHGRPQASSSSIPGSTSGATAPSRLGWVYLPPGATIDTSNMDEWTFPVGTKFWKEFVVAGVLTETRLLHKVSAILLVCHDLPVVVRTGRRRPS